MLKIYSVKYISNIPLDSPGSSPYNHSYTESLQFGKWGSEEN